MKTSVPVKTSAPVKKEPCIEAQNLTDDLIEKTEGETFEVTFKIPGDPTPEVFFYKDEEPFEDSKHTQITNNKDEWTLVISDLTEADSGIYVVEAENDNGLVEKEFEIDVARKCCLKC